MPVTLGNIVDALHALGGEAHYKQIADYIVANFEPPFPADPAASVRARLQENCSDYTAYLGQADLFESERGSGTWRFRSTEKDNEAFRLEASEYKGQEGRMEVHFRMERKRDAKLVRLFKQSLSECRCEACATNLEEVYGSLAIDFIEAHHRVPIAELAEDHESAIADFAALCPNCHRILHRNANLSVESLRQFLFERSPQADVNRLTWRQAVEKAVRQLVLEKGAASFSRQELIQCQLAKIVADVQAQGETPAQTLSRVLQELRDEGIIAFEGEKGDYRFLG